MDSLDTIAVPKTIWVRRGMFRKGSSIPVDSIGKFDLIVHPGDAVPHASSEVEHDAQVELVEAITVLDSDEMWDRVDARRRIGVPEGSTAVYVQLGAGRINDIDSEIRMVVDALLGDAKVHVILGESMLGDRLRIDLERIHLIRDYPNALFLRAFDHSVQAGGYNSFHEMRALRIPTLFLPNMNTGMDDQLARCRVAEKEGWGLVAAEDRSSINQDVQKLLKMSASNVDGHDTENGADQIAEMVLH
ncbi:MAG: hypothetical protein ACJZ59_02130 [Candidatus Thalassarchaeaceae archaeon]